MEDSMLDMPNLAYDEKIGNKRVRDDENETKTGRLEKRPSGILGVNIDQDYKHDGGQREEPYGGAGGGGIIDTFISNVFHKNESGTKEEQEEVKIVLKVENTSENEGGDGGGEGGDGGGMINTFFSNIFQNNTSENDDCDCVREVVEKPEGDLDDLNANKSTKKGDTLQDLPSKNLEGQQLKMKPDDYSERVFFLNNN